METIYRVVKNKDNPYVMINKDMVNDNRLSARAKGILLYILSKPDNWQIYESEVTKHFRDGLKSIKSGFKELISLGYVHRVRLRADTGHFKGWQYFVYESPVIAPKITETPFTDVGQRHATNNDYKPSTEPSYYTNRTTRTIADQTSPNDP